MTRIFETCILMNQAGSVFCKTAKEKRRTEAVLRVTTTIPVDGFHILNILYTEFKCNTVHTQNIQLYKLKASMHFREQSKNLIISFAGESIGRTRFIFP